MKLNLMNTDIFFQNYKQKNKTIFEDECVLDDARITKIINICKEYNVKIVPYLYVLNHLARSKKNMVAFTKYFITYLVKAEMLDTYEHTDIYNILSIDIEFIIALIVCMQYYF
jgi:hypothetical protein